MRSSRTASRSSTPALLGRDELLARRGLPPHEIEGELALRALQRLGVERARVPFELPAGIADALRAGGVELMIDPEAFVERRRRKTDAQLEGIRRAQAAADAAMSVAAEMIHAGGTTAEEVRAAMQAVCEERGCELPDDVVVAPGAQGAAGHDSGSGPLGDGEPVVVDIWPRDKASRCWADMTRTFIAGGREPSEEIARYWELTRESLRRIYPMVRAGADGRAIYEASCEPYHEAGLPTQLSKEPGTVLRDGFFHGLGHGVGLDIHERPGLGRWRRHAAGRRRDHARARVLPPGLRRRPARGPRDRHRGRLRDIDGVSVRALKERSGRLS